MRLAAVLACGLVGAGYSAVKASAAVAACASQVWSVLNGPSTVHSDGTDLLVLPALGLAWLVWRHVRSGPPLDRLRRLFVVLVVLPVSSLAVAATSAPFYDDAIAVTVWHGHIVIGTDNAYHQPRSVDSWSESPDAGLTFSSMGGDLTTFLGALPTLDTAATTGCQPSAPRHCFRVVPGRLQVEESTDGGGTWQVAWQVTEAQRHRLVVRYPELGDPDIYLTSVALVVVDQPGGCVVLVADGRDGFVRRDVSGTWTRIGFGTRIEAGASYPQSAPAIPPAAQASAAQAPGAQAPSVPSVGAVFPPAIAIALFAAGWVLLLGVGAAQVRAGRAGQLWASAPLVAFGSLIAWVFRWVAGQNAPVLVVTAAWLFAALVVAAGVVLGLVLALGEGYLRRRAAVLIPLVALGTGLAMVAPFVTLATLGWPAHRVPVAVAVALLGGAGSLALGLRYRSVPPLRPRPPAPPA